MYADPFWLTLEILLARVRQRARAAAAGDAEAGGLTVEWILIVAALAVVAIAAGAFIAAKVRSEEAKIP